MSIVAVLTAAANAAPPPEAVGVFHIDFADSSDANVDGWPDGWTRQRGPGYPHYVRVQLADDPPDNRCLRIDLDGGAAAALSPPIPIEPAYSYLLVARLKTAGLKRDEAHVSVTLLDEDRRPLEKFASPRFTECGEWRELRTPPISASDHRARFAVIGLHLEPGAGQDITGSAMFDDIWLGRLPRLTLDAAAPLHVFHDPAEVEIVCNLSGFEDNDWGLTFELLDAQGASVDRAERHLRAPAATTDASLAEIEAAANASRNVWAPEGVPWRPAVRDFGFYRARVTMHGRRDAIYTREITLAVIHPRVAVARGEFGWTLPRGDEGLTAVQLAQLLGESGATWVKLPLWYGEDDLARADELSALVERLSARRIQVVGLLSDPPQEVRAHFGDSEPLTAATLFAAPPEVWYPSLEGVMAGLAIKVRHWQLGDDLDVSLVGDPDLAKKIGAVRDQLTQLDPESRVGLGWNWLNELPQVERPPWAFLSLSAEPALTDGELAASLRSTADPALRRWVAMQPLPRGRYSTTDRAVDLAQRMLAAKVNGAEGIFVPDPFDAERGLLNPDGTPAELFLVWRTLAHALSGAEHLGSALLPGGSRNHVFSRGHDAVLIVWNDSPQTETLFLGEQVQQTDLWGRGLPVRGEGERQVIDVGPLPTVVAGINEPIIRMAMSTELALGQLPSVLGVPHRNPIAVRNYFPRGASGRVTIVAPEGWHVSPPWFEFQLATGEELRQQLDFTFPFNADCGLQTVLLEFDVSADRRYRFSVERLLEVGLGDVVLEAAAHLGADGELVIEQRLTNNTDRTVNFKCELYAPNRRRLRSIVQGLGRGTDTQVHRLPSGADLIGQQLWIRAEELGGQRVLSDRFTVEP